MTLHWYGGRSDVEAEHIAQQEAFALAAEATSERMLLVPSPLIQVQLTNSSFLGSRTSSVFVDHLSTSPPVLDHWCYHSHTVSSARSPHQDDSSDSRMMSSAALSMWHRTHCAAGSLVQCPTSDTLLLMPYSVTQVQPMIRIKCLKAAKLHVLHMRRRGILTCRFPSSCSGKLLLSICA